MKISDLFGKVNNYSNPKVGNKNGQNSDGSSNIVDYNNAGSDKTTISGKARLLSQVSRIAEDDDSKRRQRIAELKAKVDSGEYLSSMSSKDVAEKMDDFFSDRV